MCNLGTIPASANKPWLANMTEKQFLAEQAAVSRAALARCVTDIKGTVASLARPCAARHPWMITGSAAAAGFVAGRLLKARNVRAGETRARPKSSVLSMVGSVLGVVLPPLFRGWFGSSTGDGAVPSAAEGALHDDDGGTNVRDRHGGVRS